MKNTTDDIALRLEAFKIIAGLAPYAASGFTLDQLMNGANRLFIYVTTGEIPKENG